MNVSSLAVLLNHTVPPNPAANYGVAFVNLVDAHPFLLSDTGARNRLRDHFCDHARRRLGDAGAQAAEEAMGIQFGKCCSRRLQTQMAGAAR